MTTTINTDDICGPMDLEPGTYHVGGHEFVVTRRFQRRSYRVDGLRVDRVVFEALFATALLLARAAATSDNPKGDK